MREIEVTAIKPELLTDYLSFARSLSFPGLSLRVKCCDSVALIL